MFVCVEGVNSVGEQYGREFVISDGCVDVAAASATLLQYSCTINCTTDYQYWGMYM